LSHWQRRVKSRKKGIIYAALKATIRRPESQGSWFMVHGAWSMYRGICSRDKNGNTIHNAIMVTCRLLRHRHRKRERREALRCPHHLILLPSVGGKNQESEQTERCHPKWGWVEGSSLSQLFLINAIRLEGCRCSGARHKMQITRRNNQIENETEQNGIKVGDERKLLHKGNKQHTIAQPKGKGRTRRKCSPGRAFPRPLLETPNPKSHPLRRAGGGKASKIN